MSVGPISKLIFVADILLSMLSGGLDVIEGKLNKIRISSSSTRKQISRHMIDLSAVTVSITIT